MLLSLQLVLPPEGHLEVSQGAGEPPDEVSRPADHAVLLSLRCLHVDARRGILVEQELGGTSSKKRSGLGGR